MQGWVTYWEEGRQDEKNSRVKGVHAWAVQRWVTSWVDRRGVLVPFDQ